MKTVLLTGATGFLGSHIAEKLLKNGNKVIALKRSTSNLWRCNAFIDKIQWLDYDNLNEIESVIINLRPEILIHAAWNGVSAVDRDNLSKQDRNVSFLDSLFEIIKKTNISKIISLGSQAEYGNFEGSIDENFELNPKTAYGSSKVKVLALLKSFAEQNNIEWYWIRLFSIFGPREGGDWLIPVTINNLVEQKEMMLTSCEQKYDYLFVKDFVSGIYKVVNCASDFSGVYNLSSNNSIKIKDLLLNIEIRLTPNKNLLLFGKLPYRANQVMNMLGNSNLFYKTFNFKPVYSINDGLNETIDYYLNNQKWNDDQL